MWSCMRVETVESPCQSTQRIYKWYSTEKKLNATKVDRFLTHLNFMFTKF